MQVWGCLLPTQTGNWGIRLWIKVNRENLKSKISRWKRCHRDTPATCQAPYMAHWWSYTKSSIKHQPQPTKRLHALKIHDQLANPMELKRKSAATLSLTIQYNCAWEGSLACSLRVVWTHSMQQISFTTNSFQIYSLEIYLLTCHQFYWLVRYWLGRLL